MFISSTQISYEDNGRILFRLYDQIYEPEDSEYEHHSHKDFQISLCTAGHGTYLINETDEYPIVPGSAFFFKSDQPHNIRFIEKDEHIHLKTIHFAASFIMPGGPNEMDVKFLNAFFNPQETTACVPSSSYSASDISMLINEIEREGNLKRPFYHNMIKSKLLSMLVIINREAGITEESSSIHAEENAVTIPEIYQSMQYIDKHYKENLTLEELAAQVGLSRSYYSHLFKRINGMSPIDYVIQIRIERSLSGLKRTNLNITQIALKYGFNNTANYNRAFKMKMGMTPSEFRKRSKTESITDW